MNLLSHPISLAVLLVACLAGVVAAVLVMPGSQILAVVLFGGAAGVFGSSLYDTILEKKFFS